MTVRTLWLSSATPWPRASLARPLFSARRSGTSSARNVSGRAERPSVQAAATVQKICRLFVMPSIYPLTSIVATSAGLHGDTDPGAIPPPAWPPAAFSYCAAV